MSLKPNFANRARSANILFGVLFSFAGTQLPAITILIAIAATSNLAVAQNGWTPPNDRTSGVYSAANAQPFAASPASHVSFPEAPVAFDPGVRIANLEIPSSPHAGVSTNSNTDSTSVLSNLKTATSEKLSGLVGALNLDGGLMKKFQSVFGRSDIGKMLGSLCLVLGIYFAFVWVIRKISPAGNRGLPKEVIELIGQAPFGPRRSLQLVRLGSKLLLLINSPEGTQPIGEITDPNEVAYLTSLCPGKNTNPTTRSAYTQPATIQSTAPATTQPPAQSNSNLANILQALEKAAKQGGAVFEA
jgi:flagellar biogenesis protein FliO